VLDRSSLSEYLALRRLDKAESILAVDEAHNLDDLVLEEIRLLSNRLGTTDDSRRSCSSAIRRSSAASPSGPIKGLVERVATHVHLSPLDADEVLELLKQHDAKRDWPIDLVERIHLFTEGRPGRIARLIPILSEKGRMPIDRPKD